MPLETFFFQAKLHCSGSREYFIYKDDLIDFYACLNED